jgi:hypothetical protein
MQNRARPIGVIITGLFLVVISVGAWLATATPANAQCGSQASSCKNCHEVQGEMSVNADGTEWHPSHAFGDFCYICHGGNSQATEKDAAHEGMVSPLFDIQASCQQCHYDDLEERAEVYAGILGVELSNNTAADPQGAVDPTDVSSSTGIGLMAPTDLVVDDPNTVDYVERFNLLVLGQKPINIGNLIVGGMIGVVLLGGGAFVIHNEGWAGVDFDKVDQYPSDLVELLPKISKLTPQARKKLADLLSDPAKADEYLAKFDRSEE